MQLSNLANKTVLITGASSGIGEACAKAFAAENARVILAARRMDRLQALADNLKQQFHADVHIIQLDVRDAKLVEDTINTLPKDWRDIDILINSAGLALGTDKLQDGKIDDWNTMIDTNINGLLYMTHAVLPGMLSRNRGHVINIGSIAGHEQYPAGNVYSATKHAVRALTKSLRIDLLGTPIRVSSIDPGAVETEFSVVRWNDKERAQNFYADFTPLRGEDVAEAIVFCASRPPHVDVAEIILMPTDQASANHLYRRPNESVSR